MPASKTATPVKPVEKVRAPVLAFVNWRIPKGKQGSASFDEHHIRSKKGFVLKDDKYLTREERGLYDLAVAHGGTAIVMVEMRIQVAEDKSSEAVDISKVKLVA